MPSIDWNKPAAYDAAAKAAFHSAARRQLRKLADELGFTPGTYDLRANKAGIAVSGEITLHHDRVYVQVSQPVTGGRDGILIRTCEGRSDYSGGPNHFAALDALDDIPGLARRVRGIMPEFRTEELLDSQTDEERDEYYRRLSM
jgi:hypothetical protein